MPEPLVTREQAEAIAVGCIRKEWNDPQMLARTIMALYDLDAAKDSCIDRLRDGWVPHQVSDGGWWWVGRSGRRRKPQQMSPAEITIMAGKDGL